MGCYSADLAPGRDNTSGTARLHGCSGKLRLDPAELSLCGAIARRNFGELRRGCAMFDSARISARGAAAALPAALFAACAARASAGRSPEANAVSMPPSNSGKSAAKISRSSMAACRSSSPRISASAAKSMAAFVSAGPSAQEKSGGDSRMMESPSHFWSMACSFRKTTGLAR